MAETIYPGMPVEKEPTSGEIREGSTVIVKRTSGEEEDGWKVQNLYRANDGEYYTTIVNADETLMKDEIPLSELKLSETK